MPAKQPRPASHFRLDLGGHEGVGMFRECTGLDSETTVIEQHSVDDNGRPTIRRVPGATVWSHIVLKRGVDESLDVWKWRQTVLQEGPDNARIDGNIALIDYTGKTIATWKFDQGWPVKYTGSALNASGNEVALEEVHICHEGLERM
jgi:phage tail-like protein